MSRLFSTSDHRGLLTPLNEAPYARGSSDVAWDDQPGTILHALQGATALTIDSFRDTPAYIACLRHDLNPDVTFWFQLSHRWNRSQVQPHIHLLPLANGTGNVRIVGHYAWATRGLPLPAFAGWTSFTKDTSITPADLYNEVVVSVGLIDVPTIAQRESAFFVFRFTRPGADPADTYAAVKDHGVPAANLGLMGCDVHFVAEKLGTTTPFGAL